MEIDLRAEFLQILDGGERVEVCLGEKFDAPCRRELAEGVERLSRPVAKLVDDRTGEREGDAEPVAEPSGQPVEEAGGRPIGPLRDSSENSGVGLVNEIVVPGANVEVRVVPQPVGLMDLQVEADRGHAAISR